MRKILNRFGDNAGVVPKKGYSEADETSLHQNQSLIAIAKTDTIMILLIHTSPAFTDQRLAYQPPKAWPIASTNPVVQTIFPSNAKTITEIAVYKIATKTLR